MHTDIVGIFFIFSFLHLLINNGLRSVPYNNINNNYSLHYGTARRPYLLTHHLFLLWLLGEFKHQPRHDIARNDISVIFPASCGIVSSVNI